jgi:cellobiose epimerase
MTGLVEYYLASGKEEALEWADLVFDLLLDKAADRDMGFIEDFDGAHWPVLNADQMRLSEQQGIKTIDMHANVLEGMMYLAGATDADKHKNALYRLLDLICIMGIHLDHGCTITAFDADWNPVGDSQGRMTTSYGLNVELAWFIWQAASVLKEENEMYHTTAIRLVDHALAFGFDNERGGLAAFGPITGHVLQAEEMGEERLLKSWWAQAELLNALCDACRRTGDIKYFDALVKTFDWIQKFQMDHEYGDWYQDTCWRTGQPVTTDKGAEFKTAFHAGRALIRAINAFREWV